MQAETLSENRDKIDIELINVMSDIIVIIAVHQLHVRSALPTAGAAFVSPPKIPYSRLCCLVNLALCVFGYGCSYEYIAVAICSLWVCLLCELYRVRSSQSLGTETQIWESAFTRASYSQHYFSLNTQTLSGFVKTHLIDWISWVLSVQYNTIIHRSRIYCRIVKRLFS